MQIILREDVHNLGKSGDVVNVREGFGRNYLLPRKLAVLASTRNLSQMEHEKRVIEARDRKRLKTAGSLKDKIEALSINVAKQVGEENRLFGSVTSKEIGEALKAEGVELDRRAILVEEPIKTLGVHTVNVKLARDVTAALKVWVVAQ